MKQMLTSSKLLIAPLPLSHLVGSTRPTTTSHYDPSPSDTGTESNSHSSSNSHITKDDCTSHSSNNGHITKDDRHITKDNGHITKNDRHITQDDKCITQGNLLIAKDNRCLQYTSFFIFFCSYTGLYTTYIPELAIHSAQDQVSMALATTPPPANVGTIGIDLFNHVNNQIKFFHSIY